MVRRGGVVVPLPPGKQRTVLAALLLNAGHGVSLDELADVLWGASPPSSARVTTQNYVMRLRKALGSAGSRISTQPRGYRIQADANELDVSRFQAHLGTADAAAAEHSWEAAAAEARTGLALWRGEPLADVDSELLGMRDAPRLADLRLRALEIRIDADLHLGRHSEVIDELRQLAGANPLRERLHGMLMLALYRDGRQAESLAGYQHLRDVLVQELGIEPGPDLRDLHQRILTADPALAAAGPGQPEDTQPPRPLPRELPPTVPGFTGRAGELRTLTQLLDQPGQQAPGTVVISAIGGTAGVGKTALAVHWAHQVADRFPDGQLYANLRGYDPDQPMPAGDALAGFLRSLGVPGPDIPPETGQRAARYRSLLAGKQMLIVLDNAGSADQVRPLLPGTPVCTVLVTSRDTLAGLVARDGATRLDLDILPLEDAVALLQTLIGPSADTNSAAATKLADHCCRLPLALRVAAELAVSRPTMPLAELTGELTDLRTRLDLLDAGGDPSTQVRAVFSWSYRHLDAETARTFRLVGLHPGPDLDPYATAALTGATVSRTRRALDVLTRVHLIQPSSPGRHGMHDLLRSYARELAATQDGEEEQRAALTRLFDHYLYATATAMDTLFPADRHFRPRIAPTTTPVPPLADPAAARGWLDGERAALLVAVGHTATHGWPGHATQMSATVARYLRNGGHYPEALTVFSHALEAARRTGDRAAMATALFDIGSVDWQQSRLQQAADKHRQALALFRSAGDRAGEARALVGVGLAEKDLGRNERAARYQQKAVIIFRDIGDRFGEARALGDLGAVLRRQGRYHEAAACHHQTLDLAREVGDREGEAWALARLGIVDLGLGRYQPAAEYLQQALAVFQEMGNRKDEAEILARLGEVHAGLGHYEQATANFEQALFTFREIGDPDQEAEVFNSLAEVLFQTGGADKAHAQHAAALRLATEAGTPLQQARAHSGLARACQASGDSRQALHHWQQALTHYTAIGAPDADEIRARLAAAAADSDDDHEPTEEAGGAAAPLPRPGGRSPPDRSP